MKKIIFILSVFLLIPYVYAQDMGSDFYSKIDFEKLDLSAEQIAKIKKLNRKKGLEFKAIGQSNLPGYEKGQRKRALALEHKDAIRQILSEKQIHIWESHHGDMDTNEGLRDIFKDDYDIRLKQLEIKYEKDKLFIKNSSMHEDIKENELKILKKAYKNEKNRLKEERDRLVKGGIFS